MLRVAGREEVVASRTQEAGAGASYFFASSRILAMLPVLTASL